MRLLAIEARQNATYYLSRYQQVEGFGAELFVLNGVGEQDFWPAARYRVAGSQKIDDIVAAATHWHAEHEFDGVLTFSESGVMTVAAVAEALGLPGVGVDAARSSRNKLLMRQAHQRGGAPHPRFQFVTSLNEAMAAAAEFGYPVILKPTLGAASNFVFRIDTPRDMRVRYADAVAGIARMSWFLMEADGMDLGPHGLLVESFLDGHEHLIEALAWDDEVYLGSVVDRVTVEGGTFDDDVHHAPTSLSQQDLAAAHRVVTAAAHAQGLRRAAMHAEVRFHQGQAHILEIAIRPGGGGLDLVARVTADYCPIRAVMDVARGVKPQVRHYQPTGVHVTGMCLICDAGVIETVTVPPEVTNSDRVPMLKITARLGDVIRRPPEGNSILGFLYTTGNSMDDAMRTMTGYADKIQVRFAGDAPASQDRADGDRTDRDHAAEVRPRIDYDGRRFRPVNDANAEPSRVAVYHQDGDLLWGEFLGGRARRGALTGTCAPDGSLDFAYCMVTDSGDVISGHCASTPQVLDDGRIRLHEMWERYGRHAGSGTSDIEEIAASEENSARNQSETARAGTATGPNPRGGAS